MVIDVQNRAIHTSYDHPLLLRAREDRDPERLAALIETLRRPDGRLDTSGYVQVDQSIDDNLLTLEGKKFFIDRGTGVVTADPTWYLGLFESNSTPTTSWDGNWGEVTVGDATEFIDYDEATRQACVFTAATGTTRVSATNPTRAVITIATGVTNKSIYGICVTNNSTKRYASGAAKLLAAVRFAQAKVYNEAEVKSLGYEIYFP